MKKNIANAIATTSVTATIATEQRVAARARKKAAAKKRAKRNSYKKEIKTCTHWNYIPEDFEVKTILSPVHTGDKKCIIENYTVIINRQKGGKLIVIGKDDQSIVIITRLCKNFSYIKNAYHDLILGYPEAWEAEIKTFPENQKQEFLNNYMIGNYIYNYDRSPKSCYQYSLNDNIMFWEVEKHYPDLYNKDNCFLFDYEDKYDEQREMYINSTKEFSLLNIIYCAHQIKGAMLTDQEIDSLKEWSHLQKYTASWHAKIPAKTIASLWSIANDKKILLEILANLEGMSNCCITYLESVISELSEEEQYKFTLRIENGLYSMFDLKVLAEHAIFSLPADCKLNISSINRFIKECKYRHAIGDTYFAMFKETKEKHSTEFIQLQNGFRNKFRKVPNIIDLIQIYKEVNKISIKYLVNSFNVKQMKEILSLKGVSKYDGICLMYTGKYQQLKGLPVQILSMLSKINDDSFISWIADHKKTSDNKLFEIINNYDVLKEIDFKQKPTLNEVNEFLCLGESILESRKVSQKYDFSWDNLVCELRKTAVHNKLQTAYILDGKDPRQTTIGYDTNCCQHLDGAGASAMLYGLLYEKGGFWVIEEKNKIVAQAELWEGQLENGRDGNYTDVLVFDNIELANDRDFNLIRGTLEKWLEESPYENVIMGTGYNVLAQGYKFVNEQLIQPVCDKVSYPYTDTQHTVWLKKDDAVQYVKETDDENEEDEFFLPFE